MDLKDLRRVIIQGVISRQHPKVIQLNQKGVIIQGENQRQHQ